MATHPKNDRSDPYADQIAAFESSVRTELREYEKRVQERITGAVIDFQRRFSRVITLSGVALLVLAILGTWAFFQVKSIRTRVLQVDNLFLQARQALEQVENTKKDLLKTEVAARAALKEAESLNGQVADALKQVKTASDGAKVQIDQVIKWSESAKDNATQAKAQAETAAASAKNLNEQLNTADAKAKQILVNAENSKNEVYALELRLQTMASAVGRLSRALSENNRDDVAKAVADIDQLVKKGSK